MNNDPSPDERESTLSGGRMLVWASVFTVAAFFAWASWAELDQITRAQGQVIASSRNQLVQTPDGGVLQELLVREGAVVKRGQLLVRFERTRAEAAFEEATGKVAGLRAQAARLEAEVFGGAPKFAGIPDRYAEFRRSQQTLFDRRQAAVHEEIRSLQRSLELVNAELQMNIPLQKTGDVSQAEILKLQRQVSEIQGQMTNRRNKYLQDSQAELAKVREDLSAAEQQLAQRREQLSYTEAYAPMDGIVRNVRLTTRGGVARPGEELMQIVPVDGDLIFEAKLKPSDIAFIRPGLPSTIKLDAYDYTIHGQLHGTVTYISADTLPEDNKSEQANYRVQVKTDGQSLKSPRGEKIEIQPGMTATIEIKTGSNTVLRYLAKPLVKTLSQSLTER